jgi:hypothetical protein
VEVIENKVILCGWVFGTISATGSSVQHDSVTRSPDVQAGFDQFARGEARTYDKTSGRQLAERIKSRGRAARAKKR